MIPYYVLIGAPLLFALFHTLSLDRPLNPFPKKNYTIVFFFFIYFVLLALRREDIGVDTAGYLRTFSRFSDLSLSQAFIASRWEAGFVVFTKVIAFLFPSPRVFLVLVSFLSVYPVARLFYLESEDDVTGMALFMIFPNFMMLFSGLRQSLAMALAPLIYYAVRERRLWRALLLAGLATLFHKSALILFVMYPLYHAQLKPKHLYWLVPGYLFTFFNSARLYYLFLPLFGEDYAARFDELIQTGATTMIILFSLFVAYAFIAPDNELMDKDTLGLRNILVLVLFVQLFATVSPLAMRMNYYFLPFVALLVPKISHRITRVDRRYVHLIQIGMVGFFLVYHLLKIQSVDKFEHLSV